MRPSATARIGRSVANAETEVVRQMSASAVDPSVFGPPYVEIDVARTAPSPCRFKKFDMPVPPRFQQ